MSQSYQNLASDQICKVQNDKKLISFHDRLRACLLYTSPSPRDCS